MTGKTSGQARAGSYTEVDEAAAKTTPGTEARRKGGVEPANRQAQRDWQDSAKESGD